jgi:prepilin-type N-terminal cleavage/methylation domain-containing protein
MRRGKKHRYKDQRNQAGFSLIELAVVLIVVGLIVGMSSVTANLQRAASYNTILARFVLTWRESYNTYFNYHGYVVGDGPPIVDGGPGLTGQVNGTNAPGAALCREDLLDYMIQGGVELATGRARDFEFLDLYQAPDNIQRQVEVCFLHIPDWFIGPAVTDTVPANVMRLTGLTSDLARRIDAAIDGYADAAWGDFRRIENYANATSLPWPDMYDNNDEIIMVEAYLRMAQ